MFHDLTRPSHFDGYYLAINTKPVFLHIIQQFPHKMIEIESMSRYVSPINPAVFPHLTIVLLGIGIFFTAWFFVYEVAGTKYTRDLFKELLMSLVAAIFSGSGILFLMLWAGIYV